MKQNWNKAELKLFYFSFISQCASGVSPVNVCVACVGVLGAVCSIVWISLVHESPAEHPRISPEEREYIEKVLSTKDEDKVRTASTLN